ncbi:hypothetical protein ACTG15_05450 [Aeromonas sp. 164P]
MSNKTLQSLFHYKRWADSELMDAIATLDAQQYGDAHHTCLRIFHKLDKLGHPPFRVSHYQAACRHQRSYRFEVMPADIGWRERLSDLESNSPCTAVH